jgi:uncharacterized membrane protein YkvA (DUF1232 family)
MIQQLRRAAQKIRQDVALYRLILKDPRTPRLARWLLGLAVGYILNPIDVVPDFIPVLGQIDDLLIVALLVFLALRMIPNEVVEQSRDKIESIE